MKGEDDEKVIRPMLIAYDIKLMRPACALIAAILRANPACSAKFNTRHWLLTKTPDMCVYPVTPKQLEQLVQLTEKHNQ